MKKVLYFFSAALLMLSGCTKFAEDEAIKFDTATAPTITVTVVDDNTVAVTVAGAANTGFYSYAVAAGAATTVNGASLLSKPSGVGSLASGVVDFSVKPDTTFRVKDLSANTAYTVYAVAASKMGIVSDVASQSVVTSDTTIPIISKLGSDAVETDNELTFEFNEPVSVSFGVGSIVAHYFAENVYTEGGDLIEVQTVPIPAENVSVDGKTLTIKIPVDPIPGAIVLFTMGEGVVKNDVGLNSAAFDEYAIAWDDGELETDGMGFQYEKAAWDFALPMIEDEEGNLVRMPADTTIYFSTWNMLVTSFVAQDLVTPEMNGIIAPETAGGIVVQYSALSGRRVTYPATQFGALNDTTAAFLLDEAPNYGETVGFTVAEDAFQDIWGNGNNAFTTIFETEDEVQVNGNYFYSYGYKPEQLYGSYTFDGEAYYAGPQRETKVVIGPCTDEDALEEGFNVVVYDLFKSQTCTDDLTAYSPFDYTVFYGVFNQHSGELVLDGDAIGIGLHSTYGWKNYVCIWNEETGKIPFLMPEAGTLYLTSEVSVVLYKLGTWDAILEGTLSKFSDDYTFEIPEEDEEEVAAKPRYVLKPEAGAGRELRKRE